MPYLDYSIIAASVVLGVGLHVWLYLRIRSWMDRDLALSFAGEDPGKCDYMLACLVRARTEKVSRCELPQWLERESQGYAGAIESP